MLHAGILFYLCGLLSLLAGLVILNLHNKWVDWRVIITVLGWLMDHCWHNAHRLAEFAIAVGSIIHGGRRYDRGSAGSRCAGSFPKLQGLPAARLRRGTTGLNARCWHFKRPTPFLG
jgi:hypothetical protein